MLLEEWMWRNATVTDGLLVRADCWTKVLFMSEKCTSALINSKQQAHSTKKENLTKLNYETKNSYFRQLPWFTLTLKTALIHCWITFCRHFCLSKTSKSVKNIKILDITMLIVANACVQYSITLKQPQKNWSETLKTLFLLIFSISACVHFA